MKVFDSHFHIIDPRFPLVANNGYLPPAYTVEDYLAATAPFSFSGGAVVSGSFQAFDQSYLISALKQLGPRYVGVTQLPASTSDDEILRLRAARICAIRFNVQRGGSEKLAALASLAQRVYDLARWHVELYIQSSDLPPLLPTLLRLPAVSIDHLGLTRAGFPTLLKLAEKGVKVKATGFGRVDFDPIGALKELARANPDCLLFGTDLPSTRAPRPFHAADLALIRDTFDPPLAEKILYKNAMEFYFR